MLGATHSDRSVVGGRLRPKRAPTAIWEAGRCGNFHEREVCGGGWGESSGSGPSEKGRVFPGRGNSVSKGSEACWAMCLHVFWGGW